MAIIAPLDLNKFIDNLQLKEVTSPSILSSKGKYDVDGLFSEVTFGLDRSPERRKTYAYIKLNTRVVHPFIYEVLKKIEQKVIDLIDGATFFFNESDGTLSKEKTETHTKELSGFDGAMFALANGLKFRGDTEIRDKIIERLREVMKDGTAFIDKSLVIPPDFRPATIAQDGTLMGVDDINATYIKLLNFSKKIKLTDNNDKNGVMSDSALIRKEIQNLINDLYTLGKLKSGKKTGIGRAGLLGKRVDFSARSVITGGYDIPIGYVGVPYRILANISQPFLVYHFTKVIAEGSQDYEMFLDILRKNRFDESNNTMVVTNFLNDISEDKIKLTKEEEAFIIRTFQDALNEKYVLLKRDPSLHKGSWQSFKVVVEAGVAIGLNITSTTLFNADFDGDCVVSRVKLYY